MEYDSGKIDEVSRPISNKERKSSRDHAPIGRGTGFDKLKFKKQSYKTGWKRELPSQRLTIIKK